MPSKTSSLDTGFRVCGEWIKGRERGAREKSAISLFYGLTPAAQARVNPKALPQNGESPPVINRNYDQSLSMSPRVQSGRLVNIAHFWRCEGGLARLCAAKWGELSLSFHSGNLSRESGARSWGCRRLDLWLRFTITEPRCQVQKRLAHSVFPTSSEIRKSRIDQNLRAIRLMLRAGEINHAETS
ncbi:MAG: hypothetical protein ABSE36_16075 [Terracidiphilus sp.]|jgi:hypothetical protein